MKREPPLFSASSSGEKRLSFSPQTLSPQTLSSQNIQSNIETDELNTGHGDLETDCQNIQNNIETDEPLLSHKPSFMLSPQTQLLPQTQLFLHSQESNPSFTPSFIRFCESIATACRIQDLLLTLKARLPKKFKTEEWILFYPSLTGLRRAYIRNNQFYEKSANQPWPSFKEIQFSDRKTQLYIAEHQGRPFAGGLVVPLLCGGWHGHFQAFLFIECQVKGPSAKPLMDFFKQAFFILCLAFKKAFIDTDTRQEAYLWNGLFNHWKEPLAVLKDFSPVHINRSFQKLLSLSPDFLQQKIFSSNRPVPANGQFWRVYYYPITQFKGTAGILYCQDVTKKNQLKEQIQQSGKMTALALLGESAGRRLSRPLADLQHKAQALSRTQPHFQKEFIELEQATARSQKTLQNLLFFSQEKTNNRICDLNEAVEGALSFLKPVCKGMALDVRLPQPSLKVRGDVSLFQHVVYNLILNACQALDSTEHNKPPNIIVSVRQANKTQAVLKVRDNGPGIAPENLKNIFQPLWTGKKTCGGTGLGLSLARQFVRQMGGDIFVSSRQNEFTCFAVLLSLLKTEKT